MSLFRKLGPYVACLVAGTATGAGLVYLLYIRLNREIAEIRKLIHELKQELDTPSDNIRRKRSNNRSNVLRQYSLTASSGDDDDDFVDAVAGLTDDTVMEHQKDPELISFQQHLEFGPADSSPTMPEEIQGEVLISNEIGGHVLSGNESPGCEGDLPVSGQTERKEAETEVMITWEP